MPTQLSSIADIEAHVGQRVGESDWQLMTFEQIKAFADATGDQQWIHVDRERAATGPFGVPIAHGYLTLSLVAGRFFEVLELTGFDMILNYGCNKVRFPNPLKEGQRHRLVMDLKSTTAKGDWHEVIFDAAVEIEGEAKPAVAAEVVYRVLPAA